MNVPTQSISGSEVTTSTTTQSDDSYVINRPGVGLITVPVTAEGGAALRTFDSVADMAAAQTLVPGTICIIANDTYRVVAASTYTANGVEVVDLATYQAVLLGKTVSLTDTRPIAFWTGEYGASGTIELTAGAYRYSLDLTQAATADVSTAGGVGLQLLGDTTDLTALGAVDGADPAGREAFVSAMATSMTRRGLTRITARDILGQSYSLDNAADAVLSAVWAALPVGFVIDGESQKVRASATITIPEGGRLENIEAVRAFSDADGFTMSTDASTDTFVDITTTSTAGSDIAWTDGTEALDDGDKVILVQFHSQYGLNMSRGTVTKTGTDYTVDVTHPTGMTTGETGRITRIALSNNIDLHNVRFSCLDATATGPALRIYGDDQNITGLHFESIYGGMVKFLGDRILHSGFTGYCDASIGAGGFGLRDLGGVGMRSTNHDLTSGDDVYQFVPATGDSDAAYDLSCIDREYAHCTGKSLAARLFLWGQGGNQGTQMHGQIKNCGFVSISGYAGHRGVNLKANRSSARMDGLYCRDCSVDGSLDFNGKPHCVNIICDPTNDGAAPGGLDVGGVGSVLFDNLMVSAPNNIYAVEIDDLVTDSKAQITFRDGTLSAEVAGIYANGADSLEVDGTVVTLTESGPTRGIQCGDITALRSVVVRKLTATNIADSGSGVLFNSTDELADILDLHVEYVAGATTKVAAFMSPGASGRLGRLTGNYSSVGANSLSVLPSTNLNNYMTFQTAGSQGVFPQNDGRTFYWIGGNPTLTIPEDATRDIPVNFRQTFANTGGGTVTVTAAGAVDYDGTGSLATGESVTIVKVAADKWIGL